MRSLLNAQGTLGALVVGCLFGAACSDVEPGSNLTDDDNHEASTGGSGSTGPDDSKGSGSSEGSGGAMGGAKDSDETGGTGGSKDASGGQTGDSGGSTGSGGSMGLEYADLERCSYVDSSTSGMGGAAGDEPSVQLAKNAFLGEVITDSAGFTLYTFGGDVPGTCDVVPRSGCVESCLVAWPPFLADSNSVPEGLDPEDFANFEREDGSIQTAFRGWPLYTYKKDLVAGEVNGQGKGKTWHAATPREIEVRILRDTEDQKYLVDSHGFTFYTLPTDTVGDETQDPESLCEEDCRQLFVPYRGNRLTLDTTLNSEDFLSFSTPNGGRQVAFQGHPLYLYVGDETPSERNGVGELGAEIVVVLTEL